MEMDLFPKQNYTYHFNVYFYMQKYYFCKNINGYYYYLIIFSYSVQVVFCIFFYSPISCKDGNKKIDHKIVLKEKDKEPLLIGYPTPALIVEMWSGKGNDKNRQTQFA